MALSGTPTSGRKKG